MYSGKDLTIIGYTDSNFQSSPNFKKSTSSSVFTFGWGDIIRRNVIKQICIVNSIIKAKYVVASGAAKEAV